MARQAGESARGGLVAWIAVGLAAAWILTGALFKLFLGTPADLPPATRVLDDLVLNYQLAIAIELATVALAFLRPKWGWIPVAGAYLVFEAVLATQLAAGEDSCGCFGAKVTIAPERMMAIDTALLVLMVAARPWRMRDRGAPWWLALAAAAAGAVVPFVYSREATAPPAVATGAPKDGGGRKAPATRGFVSLDVGRWVGQPIEDTPLAKWIEGGIADLPLDGLWVLYRSTCDHCARHLEELAVTPPDAPFLVLVRLKEPDDNESNRQVHVLPEGGHVLHASCPDTVDYILTTPAELELEAGIVTRAKDGVAQ